MTTDREARPNDRQSGPDSVRRQNVGASVRGDSVIMPRGDSVVHANDRVIILAAGGLVKKVEKLFSVRLDFF